MLSMIIAFVAVIGATPVTAMMVMKKTDDLPLSILVGSAVAFLLTIAGFALEIALFAHTWGNGVGFVVVIIFGFILAAVLVTSPISAAIAAFLQKKGPNKPRS